MTLPHYFLPRPTAISDVATLTAFERVFTEAVERGTGGMIDYRLPAPKWQFLSYLCDHKNVLLHGSGNPEIGEFEPRKSNDVDAFGDRCAVYAASDGIWPLFFAIVDRGRHVTSLLNGCFRVLTPGEKSQPYYFFSINGDALPHAPWREGTIYVLPRDGLEPQPGEVHRGAVIEPAQWASLAPVKPLAKLAVQPGDFPFLAEIRPHDPDTLRERARADPEGFPWLDE